MMKSSVGGSAAATGMTMRGNHTFEIRGPLTTALSDARASAWAKNIQSTRPASANTGYGTP